MEFDVVTEPGVPRGIAVIAPYDFALDHELWRWTPPGITLHLTRTPYRALPVTLEMAHQINDLEMVRRVARDLLSPGPEVGAYACACGSFAGGIGGEQRLRTAIREAGIPAAVTTSGALLQALELLDVRRLAVATPYVSEVTDRLGRFLAEAGVRAVSSVQLGLSGRIWTTPYSVTCDLVRRADRRDADAIFVSCTNLPTYDLVAPLERSLGKPVLTAAQVTMWAALRALGHPVERNGQCLVDAAAGGPGYPSRV